MIGKRYHWLPKNKGMRIRLLALWRDRRGVSAVEFALIAPVLFTGLVITADIGLAVTERMTLDHVLRGAAQSAMADQGPDKVQKALEQIAARNFAAPGETTEIAEENAVTVSAVRFCACAENLSAPVACSTTCPGAASTLAYYRMEARKAYNGMLLPRIDFDLTLQVQVR
ncbi:TadE/TadG family type IV pilus assembly protein [Microvirga yunnanensis]|uniref:TadE/TadG family type IV pilus assembly protein n=1 Tax=Microvirga yunnanensis TaxID=2953740 RepID=UPI0021C80D51|nr:TadE/TadG family type IV pilus assembly protein [Microvirga sp. HBU65207]